jgi:hypothetical protein
MTLLLHARLSSVNRNVDAESRRGRSLAQDDVTSM